MPKNDVRMVSVPRELLVGLVALQDKKRLGRSTVSGSPNHGHEVPGIWELADSAKQNGDGSDCCVHGMKRFNEGFSQPVRLIFAGNDPAAFKMYDKDDAQAIFANANIKLFIKH